MDWNMTEGMDSGRPPRPPSSPEDNQDIGRRMVIIGIVYLTLTALVMGARIYCRAVLLKKMGSDDWSMIFAMLTAIPMIIFNLIAVRFGVGKHTWMTSDEDMRVSRMMNYLATIHYFLALGFTKASLLLFLVRLSPVGRLARISWAMLYFLVAFTITAFILSAIQCVPPYYLWQVIKPSESELRAHCLSQKPVQYTLLPISISTDIIIWLLPLHMVWKVQMPARQKWALFAIFSVGALAVDCGILRLIRMKKVLNSSDSMRDYLNLDIWSTTEVSMGIISGSAPAIKPLFSKFLPSFLGTLNASTSEGAFPGSLSRQKTTYALRLMDPANRNRGENNSQEGFGPTTRIDGQVTRLEDESEDFHPSEPDLENDGIYKSTGVQIKYEERV